MTENSSILARRHNYRINLDSTLKHQTKEWLIQHIRCLENNWANSEERCQHYEEILHGFEEEQNND